jgi:hypothetical protein
VGWQRLAAIERCEQASGTVDDLAHTELAPLRIRRSRDERHGVWRRVRSASVAPRVARRLAGGTNPAKAEPG